MIHNIGTVTLDSEETFADIDDAYKGLTDSEKLLVTNYGEYTEAKTEFLRLKLRDEIENVPNNEEPDDDEPDTPGQIVTPPDGEQGSRLTAHRRRITKTSQWKSRNRSYGLRL